MANNELMRTDETQPVKQRNSVSRSFRLPNDEQGELEGDAKVQRYGAVLRQREGVARGGTLDGVRLRLDQQTDTVLARVSPTAKHTDLPSSAGRWS